MVSKRQWFKWLLRALGGPEYVSRPEAERLYAEQLKGRAGGPRGRGGFIYPEARTLVRAKVPPSHLSSARGRDHRYPENVAKYAALLQKGVDLGPSWVSMSPRKMSVRPAPIRCSPLYVSDGNHRADAARRVGRAEVEVIMPVDSWDRYQRWLRSSDARACFVRARRWNRRRKER